MVKMNNITSAAQNERKQRISKLVGWLSSEGLDAAAFLKEDIESTNYNYVYYGEDLAAEEYSAILVDNSGNVCAIVQEHAFPRASSSGAFEKVLSTRQSTEQLVSHLRTLLQEKHCASVRADAASVTAGTAEKLRAIGVDADPALTAFAYGERSRKSDYEIREIEKAIRIGRRALETTLDSLKVGSRPRDVARDLKKALLDEGASSESFPTDVTVRRGVSERQLARVERGSLVLFDFGARLESNYLSDMGRTVPVGSDAKLRDFLKDVFEIKREGLHELTSGKSGNAARRDLDRIIEKAGYASVHRPGHQIGLNVHEPYEPNLAYGEENAGPLRDGHVVTWEPGIGVRDPKLSPVRFGMAHVEDMVLVAGAHPRLLGSVPLELW